MSKLGDAGIGMAAGAANGAIGQIFGLVAGGAQDRRQLKQAGKLQDLQIQGNKEMGAYNKEMALQMWKDTNASAQVEQYKKAGLNAGLMYGGGGAGGATAAAPTGSVSGQSAGDPNTGVGMGLQIASQLALQKAQKENIEADTENKKAGTENTTLNTDTGKKTQEATIKTAEEGAAKALADAVRSQQQQVITEETMKDQIRTIQEEAIQKILNNKGISIENRKKEAEVAIKQFEANMAKSGIAPNTPWYMKLVTELLDKHGLNPLK